MSAVLKIVLDQAISPEPGGIARYAEELTRALIATAPRGCRVEGIISAQPTERIEALAARLPGLGELHRVTLPRRELAAAWQLGLASGAGDGMIHAPGLLAPLRRHNRSLDHTQVVVTVHDTLAWNAPKTLTHASVTWQKQSMKRVRKHADAVIVPSHAVAEQLAQIVDLGDRVRVIPPAVSPGLVVPADAKWRAGNLDLPADYILTLGSLDPRRGLEPLLQALALPDAPDLPLLILGPATWGAVSVAQAADEAGLAEGRVRTLGYLSDADLAVVYARASAFIYPSTRESSGLPVLEALTLGTPVIHSDDPALLEVAGGAGYPVEAGGPGYPERLAAALAEVLGDEERRAHLRVLGQDRAQAFGWNDSAERVWALHAEM